MSARPLARRAAAAVVACALLASGGSGAEPDAPVHASATLPIRVFAEDTALGEAALAVAEEAWAVQIDGMGFAPPLRVVDGGVEEGFDVFLDDGVGASALVTFDILGDVPATPATDCPTIGRLNPAYMDDAALLEMCVEHVLNHGSLHAIDCIEPQMPAFDMFTVAVELLTDDEHPYWLTAYLPDFQSIPWASVDFVITNPDYVFYMFGSGLFGLFLDERYGDGDGALLAAAWARTPQDGTILTWDQEWCTADVDNEPDFLDAVAGELAARGVSMDEALAEFTAWRYFVGADDDGAHFANGGAWLGGEVARDAAYAAADLPVADAAVASKLAETGSAYVELDTAGLTAAQRIVASFAGDADARWAARLLLVPADGPATAAQIPLADERTGTSAAIDPSAFAKIVLAVTDLGDGVHDPEEGEWSTAHGDFTYSLEVVDAPVDAGTDAGADAGADPIGATGSGCSCAAAGFAPGGSLLARLFDL